MPHRLSRQVHIFSILLEPPDLSKPNNPPVKSISLSSDFTVQSITKSPLRKFWVLWLVACSKSPQKFLPLKESSESEPFMNLICCNMMLKKDSVFSESHVRLVLTSEPSVFISVCCLVLEVIWRNSEEAEVETCQKTNTSSLCTTFWTLNGDTITTRTKPILEELSFPWKSFWQNTKELSLRIHQSTPFVTAQSWWFQVF